MDAYLSAVLVEREFGGGEQSHIVDVTASALHHRDGGVGGCEPCVLKDTPVRNAGEREGGHRTAVVVQEESTNDPGATWTLGTATMHWAAQPMAKARANTRSCWNIAAEEEAISLSSKSAGQR